MSMVRPGDTVSVVLVGERGLSVLFRYRCEYLHLATSSRILFTVGVPVEVSGEPPWDHFYLALGSAGDAIAKRLAAKWIEQTGLAGECVMLGVVAVTDKMSVRS